MKTNKILLNIDNIKDIKKYKKIGITNFLFALKEFSIGDNLFELDELKNLNVNVFLDLNLIMDTEKMDNFKKIIPELDFVKGIFFEDVGIYYLLKDKNIPLIWNQSHFVINSKSINYWLKLVKSANLSNELTLNEIKEILNKVNSKIVMQVFGLNKAMYTTREILSFFSKHKNIKKIDEGILKVHNQDISYKVKESKEGTILYYNKPFNYIPYLNEIDDSKILFYLISDANYEILKKLLNNEDVNSDEKFLHEKTIYKLKE